MILNPQSIYLETMISNHLCVKVLIVIVSFFQLCSYAMCKASGSCGISSFVSFGSTGSQSFSAVQLDHGRDACPVLVLMSG